MSKTVVIRDVTFNWPKLVNAHSPFGSLQYDIQVVTDSEATKAQLEDAGVKMKKGENKTWYANVKRKAVNGKGETNEPPRVLNSEKEPMSKDLIQTMGNGSKGHLKLFSYDWEVGDRKGKSGMLVAIQVTDYVAYEGAGEDF